MEFVDVASGTFAGDGVHRYRGRRFVDGDRGDAVPSNGDVFTTIANGMGVPTKAFGINTKGEIPAMKA